MHSELSTSGKSFNLIIVIDTRQDRYTDVSNNGKPRDRVGEGGDCLRPGA